MSLDQRKVKQTLFNQSSDFLIGELLLKAGLIKQNQLDEALKLAGNKHMQIGQMLIMARHISPRDLQAAIDAQSAVRDRVMETSVAIRNLSIACQQGISFSDASQKHTQHLASITQTNRLGELLTEAGLINADQLSHAMQRSMATGLPLGRMLVLSGVINETMLSLALELQISLRDETISRQEALCALREMGGAKVVDQSGTSRLEGGAADHAGMVQPRKHGIRLGELLVLAGILSEMDVMNALEVSLVKDRQLGEVLIDHGYITPELCETALKLQSLIDSGNLDCEQASKALKEIHNGNVGLLQAMENVTSATDEGTYIDFQSLMTESQLLSSEQIQAAMELAVSNPRLMTKIIIMTGYLDEQRAEIVLACYDALVKKKIAWQDALNMLSYAWQSFNEGSVNVDQLLQKLNLSKHSERDKNLATDNRSSSKNTKPAPTLTHPQPQTPIPNLQTSTPQASTPSKASVPTPPQTPVQTGQPQASASPSNRHTGRTTGNIPVLNQLQVESSLLHPPGQPAKTIPLPKRERTGKTTTNVPALNPLMAGSDLLRPNLPGSDTNKTAKEVLPIKQSLSLKGLLTGHDLPTLNANNSKQATEANSQSNHQIDLDINAEELNLSEQEKSLIKAASSLNASPEDIMAAMHLALKKEKNVQPKPEEKE